MKNRLFYGALLAGVLLGLFMSPQVQALTIHYPDLVGVDVSYIDISEDTRDEPEALFGAPDVAGNRLDFDPVNFTANASSVTGTNASEIVDGQLNFTVMSLDNGFGISQINIGEAGDFSLAGLGAALANVTVAAPVRWSITHVDGVELMAPISGSTNLVFTPSDSYSLPADTGGTWDGEAVIDIAGQLANGQATKVEIVLDNTLTAAAADGGSAFIAKKDLGGLTISIPEPGSAVLLLCGLLGLLGIRRR